MIRCSRCTMPNTRPDTAFVDGVCSACSLHVFPTWQRSDWPARKEELIKLLDRFDGRCIVASSGGKDSHWQALTLKEMGADVTAVTATTCHLTKDGRQNIDNLTRYVRTIEVSPNRKVRARLNRLALSLVGDISWPEHVSIHRTPFKVAADTGIPLVFYGELPTRQYGGPAGSYDTKVMTQRWASEFGGFLGLRASDFVGMDGLTASDMRDYEAPDANKLAAAGVEAHFLGQYLPWDSHRNAARAISHNMTAILPSPANWWPSENLDNAQCGLHDHMMYRKFGYGRGCAQISVDIRNFSYTRANALEWIARHDGAFPFDYAGVSIDAVLDRIEMSRKQLDEVLVRFTDHSLFAGCEQLRPILKEFAA